MRLEVKGESFMLHQIRNMAGAAVAVARGILPPDLHEASLTAPVRMSLPCAPPHTLLLADCTFRPFFKGYNQPEAMVARLSGDALSLRSKGQQERADFRKQVGQQLG